LKEATIVGEIRVGITGSIYEGTSLNVIIETVPAFTYNVYLNVTHK